MRKDGCPGGVEGKEGVEGRVSWTPWTSQEWKKKKKSRERDDSRITLHFSFHMGLKLAGCRSQALFAD